MGEPRQKPGRSKQDYRTPPEFLEAVVRRFGPIMMDLAAGASNAVTDRYYGVESDSLSQDWTRLEGNLWLNPPYADIEPWARKCSEEHRAWNRILLLTPASIGTEWFSRYVHGHAFVLGLRPRLTFAAMSAPYPKDLMLSVYGLEPGFDTWDWRATLREESFTGLRATARAVAKAAEKAVKKAAEA